MTEKGDQKVGAEQTATVSLGFDMAQLQGLIAAVKEKPEAGNTKGG
ncbi:MAG: hypothetical protein ACE5LU_23595 [Anaerolineae bacterium]